MNQLALIIRNDNEGEKEISALTPLEQKVWESLRSLIKRSPDALESHLSKEDDPIDWLSPVPSVV